MLKLLFVLLVTFIVFDRIHAQLQYESEILERTLPAYGLAATADEILQIKSSCRRHLLTFRHAVDQRVLWALKMLDSSGEPKSGFVYGNNYWLGSRSQCYDTLNDAPFVLKQQIMNNNTRYRTADDENPPFDVNYFVAYFTHNSTLQYHVTLPNEDLVSLGLCLPSSCTTDELGLILKAMFEDRRLIVGQLYSADFQLIRIRDLHDDHLWLLDWRFILIKIIMTVIFVLMFLGTIYDLRMRKKRFEIVKIKEMAINENNNEMIKLSNNVEAGIIIKKHKPGIFGKIVLCFSVYSNTSIIFSTKLSGTSVAPIHGLRFLGMVWIVMIHTIFYMSDYADNKPWSWRVADGFAVQVISNSTLSVDTFFFLSGFLMAYLYFISRRDNEQRTGCGYWSSQYFSALLQRFIRLTPAYMFMVGILQLNTSWYDKISLFHMTERPHEVCQMYWWRNILYINNLFDRETMCMSWSWYLSNDMQFFVMGMLLLIISSICIYVAAALLLLLLFGSIVITGYVSYVNDYTPTMDQQLHMLDILYDPPWTRIGPYIIGMITAFIVIRLNGKLPLRKRTVVLGWLLGSSCNLVVLFGLFERRIDVLSSALYVAFSRTLWAVGLAWLLIACSTKHGGIVNKILSFKAWIPLSRLTYCAYLLNPFLINSIYLQSESAVHVDFLPNATIFLGCLLMTYVCSYVLSLMLETPIVLLMRTFCHTNVQRR